MILDEPPMMILDGEQKWLTLMRPRNKGSTGRCDEVVIQQIYLEEAFISHGLELMLWLSCV